MPGVSSDRTPQQGASATSGLTFAGQRARSNNIMVDGLDNNDLVTGTVRAMFGQEALDDRRHLVAPQDEVVQHVTVLVVLDDVPVLERDDTVALGERQRRIQLGVEKRGDGHTQAIVMVLNWFQELRERVR